MGLNIKNAEVERDIRALAELKGISLTEAVADAVRYDLERARRDVTEGRMTTPQLLEFLRSIQPRPLGHSSDHGEMYDEDGAPI